MLVQVHSSVKRLDYPVYSFIQKVIIIDKFLRLRWEKDLSRIDRFISKTLSYLRELHDETTA